MEIAARVRVFMTAAGFVLGLAACGSGNQASVVCVSANNDACINAAIDYNPVAGVRLPAAPDEAAASIACAYILPNNLFVVPPAGAPPVNGFSQAEPTFQCPRNITGTVLGTCDVLATINPDYTGPTTTDDLDITGFEGSLTVTDGAGLTADDAQAGCDNFVPIATGTADHYLLYSTWTPAAP